MTKLIKIMGTLAMAAAFLMVAARSTAADPLESDFYKTEVKIKKKLSNDKQVAQIRVIPKSGYHNNTLFPWKLTLKSGPDLPEKLTYKKQDALKFTKPEVVFEVKTGATNSEKVKALLKMSLCNDKQCKTVKVDLTF